MTTTRQIMNKGQTEALKRKANHHARRVLAKLGFKGMDYGDRLVGCCPIPHRNSKSPNDNQNAFNWLYDRGIWRCFSHNCHEQYGVDIFGLVRSAKQFHGENGFAKAINWVCEALDIQGVELKEVSSAEMNQIKNMLRRRSELKQHTSMEESMLKHLTPCNYLLHQRGFTQECIDEFKAGGSWHRLGTYGYNRLIIPVYDPLNNSLVGFSCRTLMTEDELTDYHQNTGRHIAKWIHCRNFASPYKRSQDREEDERLYMSHILFNLHRAKKYMDSLNTIIITEGPLDVMRLWEAGMKNGIATMGSALSVQQKELLHRAGVKRILDCYDRDQAGKSASQRLEKMLGRYFAIIKIAIPEGQDPGDLEPVQLRCYFKEYI
jgi:5S rRNA maturation endonuclease (ribonuclease M5)